MINVWIYPWKFMPCWPSQVESLEMLAQRHLENWQNQVHRFVDVKQTGKELWKTMDKPLNPNNTNNLEKVYTDTLFQQPESPNYNQSEKMECLQYQLVKQIAPKHISARTFWHLMLWTNPTQQLCMTWHEHLTTSPKQNSGITAQHPTSTFLPLKSCHHGFHNIPNIGSFFPKSTGKHLHSLRCLFVLIAIPSALPWNWSRVTRSWNLVYGCTRKNSCWKYCFVYS